MAKSSKPAKTAKNKSTVRNKVAEYDPNAALAPPEGASGHGLGRGFLDQDFADVRHVIDTNVTGTVYLVQLVGRAMRSRGQERILLTGSIAGFMPGTYQAV
jgi:NAD(P)-dependent dehydrogenase (short-subunit alcohol dehydrogenase family)